MRKQVLGYSDDFFWALGGAGSLCPFVHATNLLFDRSLLGGRRCLPPSPPKGGGQRLGGASGVESGVNPNTRPVEPGRALRELGYPTHLYTRQNQLFGDVVT